MNNKISIIVPCYNSEPTIKECVASILNSINNADIPEKFEIIIINDGSNDCTSNIVKEIAEVKIINHNKNLGLSAARNSGIKKSTSDYIIFIDSDIILSDNWIKKMLFNINKNKDVVGITGNLEPEPHKRISPLDKYLFGPYRGTKNIDINMPLNYKSFVFSNTIIKRSVLDDVGYFDESLSNYGGEDTELSIRIAKKHSKGMRKLTSVSAYHITHKTINQHLDNMFEYGKYNFYKIIEKHPAYKNDLGYQWVSSIKGTLLFNVVNKFICNNFIKLWPHPLFIKFLVIDSFIRGAKNKP